MQQNNKPFVSVCTPTCDRRCFIKRLIKSFDMQDYPKNRLEWIILDDGIDKIEDLVEYHPVVKYIKCNHKMNIGKKRNLLNNLTSGDIIVYMDDDDYYPPTRISHAVDKLLQVPRALCAGTTKIYVYFCHSKKIYSFGPYSDTHATANTFAFRRKLLEITRYDDSSTCGEEKTFLKNFTIPFVQLEPLKTILVISHKTNTFDKNKIIQNGNLSKKRIDNFISDIKLAELYRL